MVKIISQMRTGIMESQNRTLHLFSDGKKRISGEGDF
jgi:hypothetical protein